VVAPFTAAVGALKPDFDDGGRGRSLGGAAGHWKCASAVAAQEKPHLSAGEGAVAGSKRATSAARPGSLWPLARPTSCMGPVKIRLAGRKSCQTAPCDGRRCGALHVPHTARTCGRGPAVYSSRQPARGPIQSRADSSSASRSRPGCSRLTERQRLWTGWRLAHALPTFAPRAPRRRTGEVMRSPVGCRPGEVECRCRRFIPGPAESGWTRWPPCWLN